MWLTNIILIGLSGTVFLCRTLPHLTYQTVDTLPVYKRAVSVHVLLLIFSMSSSFTPSSDHKINAYYYDLALH